MIIFSYNNSAKLSSTLKKIDKLRSEILLTPLSIPQTSHFTWQATLSHLSGWAHLSNQAINKELITEIVSGKNLKPNSQTSITKKATDYTNSLNHLYFEWTGNKKTVSASDIKRLTSILDVSYSHEDEIISLLGYVQTGNVHPVIQAAIVHLYFYPSRLAYIASLLFLYKNGFDLKQFLAMEEFWANDKTNYLSHLQQASKLGQITLWLEYYSDSIEKQMEQLKKNIQKNLDDLITTKHFHLSDRQKQIISQLQIPGSHISNKDVQQLFQVTQITASRDLAHLSKLKLIAPHGGGRSTIYTKNI